MAPMKKWRAWRYFWRAKSPVTVREELFSSMADLPCLRLKQLRMPNVYLAASDLSPAMKRTARGCSYRENSTHNEPPAGARPGRKKAASGQIEHSFPGRGRRKLILSR